MVIAYAVLMFALSWALFWFGADDNKAVVSLLHVVLLAVPLISIVFGTIHYYNSREFIELLLAQPLTRSKIFLSEYFGVSVSLALAFLLGTGIPMLLNGTGTEGIFLLAVGVLETFIFTALAFNTSVRNNDKAKGIGVALLLWFYFAVLFDGIVLFLLYSFSDYPLEKPVLIFTALNPVDLGRVLVLLKLDTSALMGYTGALYQKFFGSGAGIIYSLLFMLMWFAAPLFLAGRKFEVRDM
jgi:Cu-processing system permease protein